MSRSVLLSDFDGPELSTAGRSLRPVAQEGGEAARWAQDLSRTPPGQSPPPSVEGPYLASELVARGPIVTSRNTSLVESFAAIVGGTSVDAERSRMLAFATRWGFLRLPLNLYRWAVHGATVEVIPAGYGEQVAVWRAESRAIAAVCRTLREADQLTKTRAEASRDWLRGRLSYVFEDASTLHAQQANAVLRFGGLPAFFGYDPVDGDDVLAQAMMPAPRRAARVSDQTSWPPLASDEELTRWKLVDDLSAPGTRIAKRYEGDGQTLIPTFERLPMEDAALVHAARRAVRQFIQGRLSRGLSQTFAADGRGIRYYPPDLISAIYLQLSFEVAGADSRKERRCDECRVLYPYQRSRRSRFCGNRCKQAWHRSRRGEPATPEGLKTTLLTTVRTNKCALSRTVADRGRDLRKQGGRARTPADGHPSDS